MGFRGSRVQISPSRLAKTDSPQSLGCGDFRFPVGGGVGSRIHSRGASGRLVPLPGDSRAKLPTGLRRSRPDRPPFAVPGRQGRTYRERLRSGGARTRRRVRRPGHRGRPLVFSTAGPGSHLVIEFLLVRIVGQPQCVEHTALARVRDRELLQMPLAPRDRRYVLHRLNGGHIL
jgi:hypothetical protein